MKMSQRAKRMDRRHKRQFSAAINLVSLMDIFTILVFFLLVNSASTVQPSTKDVQLPKSIAEKMPKETLNILVTDTNIIVNGQQVVSIVQAINSNDEVIPALAEELQYQAGKTAVAPNEAGIVERDVTIMGDRKIPYKLLRRIMMTCSKNEYSKISLAVLRKAEGKAT